MSKLISHQNSDIEEEESNVQGRDEAVILLEDAELSAEDQPESEGVSFRKIVEYEDLDAIETPDIELNTAADDKDLLEPNVSEDMQNQSLD